VSAPQTSIVRRRPAGRRISRRCWFDLVAFLAVSLATTAGVRIAIPAGDNMQPDVGPSPMSLEPRGGERWI
jgi:hypothetical protein